jgi:DNA helicase-4
LAGFDGVDAVTVKTFNAFGLGVIGKATGRKPSLAEWAEPGRDGAMIVEIIDDLRTGDDKFRHDWDLFRGFRPEHWFMERACAGQRLSRRSAGYSHRQWRNRQKRRGRMIADWLFYHGVLYQYERPYEHDTATEHHRQYRPGLFLPGDQPLSRAFRARRKGAGACHISVAIMSAGSTGNANFMPKRARGSSKPPPRNQGAAASQALQMS